MNPGDIIEWTYKQSGQLVDRIETLWSATMNRYVLIGSSRVHTLISINGECIMWLNEKGLFHARVNDSSTPTFLFASFRLFHMRVNDMLWSITPTDTDKVVPRKKQI